MFSVENLAGKLPDCSFINYVSSFDFVCLTETFADATFDFNGLFTDHMKFVSTGQKFGWSSVVDQTNRVQVCEADPN